MVGNSLDQVRPDLALVWFWFDSGLVTWPERRCFPHCRGQRTRRDRYLESTAYRYPDTQTGGYHGDRQTVTMDADRQAVTPGTHQDGAEDAQNEADDEALHPRPPCQRGRLIGSLQR